MLVPLDGKFGWIAMPCSPRSLPLGGRKLGRVANSTGVLDPLVGLFTIMMLPVSFST